MLAAKDGSFSQQMTAGDLELTQNAGNGKTVSFQLSLPTFRVMANIDASGKVVSLAVYDSERSIDMVWDENGKRIR